MNDEDKPGDGNVPPVVEKTIVEERPPAAPPAPTSSEEVIAKRIMLYADGTNRWGAKRLGLAELTDDACYVLTIGPGDITPTSHIAIALKLYGSGGRWGFETIAKADGQLPGGSLVRTVDGKIVLRIDASATQSGVAVSVPITLGVPMPIQAHDTVVLGLAEVNSVPLAPFNLMTVVSVDSTNPDNVVYYCLPRSSGNGPNGGPMPFSVNNIKRVGAPFPASGPGVTWPAGFGDIRPGDTVRVSTQGGYISKNGFLIEQIVGLYDDADEFQFNCALLRGGPPNDVQLLICEIGKLAKVTTN